jgi:small GTP-binding protein
MARLDPMERMLAGVSALVILTAANSGLTFKTFAISKPTVPSRIRRMQLKICVVGEREVGKTSLIQRYVFDTFSDAYQGTLGTQLHLLQFVKKVAAEETVEADTALFDLMGEHNARDLFRDALFWGAHGFVAVCDVTRSETFESLIDWVNVVRSVAGQVPFRILLNKSDLLPESVLPREYVDRLRAVFPNVPYSLVSAKTGSEVERAMSLLLEEIVNNVLAKGRSRREGRVIGNRILMLAGRRGSLGVTKNELLVAFTGMDYNVLMTEVGNLERTGLVSVEEIGPANFRAVLTEEGDAAVKNLGLHSYIVDEVS